MGGDRKEAGRIDFSTRFALLLSAVAFIMAVAVVPGAKAQESVAEAARNARKLPIQFSKDRKVITNADLDALHAARTASSFPLLETSQEAAQTADPAVADTSNANPAPRSCDSPEAQRLTAELQAAQQELGQLRRDLQYSPPVVSNNDLDPQYFRPGNSGFNVGSPPLLDAQPPVPGRVAEVEIQERINALNKAVRVACEPPEAARMQIVIDRAEGQLELLQREFALNQEDYDARPVTERLGGNAQLDAEWQEIHEAQSQIDELKAELAAKLPPQNEK